MTASAETQAATPRPGLFVLIAMSAMAPIALNIFVPSIPGLQDDFGVSFATVQLTLTLYLAALAAGQLLIGPLSDRFGRRPVFLAGTVVFIAASLGSALASSIELLIAGRILQAAGGCAGIVLARAIIRDLYQRDRAASAIGYVTMAMVVAPMVAPAIGGYLDGIAGWRSGFYLVALLGLAMLVMAAGRLHETHRKTAGSLGFGKLARDAASLMREPCFLGYALNSAFGSGIFFSFLAGAPFIVTSVMKLEPADYGLFFILVSIGYMFGNFLSGRYAGRFGANRMIIAGSVVQVAGLALFWLLWQMSGNHPLSIFAPMMVVAVSNGLTIPSATAAAISVRPDIAGSGAGLAGFAQIGVGALATLIVGLLHDGTRAPMIVVMTISALLSLVFLALALWSSQRAGARAAQATLRT